MDRFLKNKEQQISTSFSDIFQEEQNIINNNYSYKKFVDFQYQTKGYKGIQFLANIWQQVNYRSTGNAPYLNNFASTSFLYDKDEIQFENSFDLDGNIVTKVQKEINTKQIDQCKLYFKGLTNPQNSIQKRFKFSCGVIKSWDQNAISKFKIESQRKVIESVFKGVHNISNTEQVGAGLGLSFNWQTKKFSIYKLGFWFQDSETKMGIIHKIAGQNHILRLSNLSYSVYKKIDNSQELGIKMVYNQDKEKKYKMVIGTKINQYENLEYGFKVDDEFKVGSYFKFNISDNASVTMSNKMDINLRSARDDSDLGSASKFPFGIKFEIHE